MALFLGIDGGGTKTTCAVADDRSVLATATAGASNIVRVGEGEARASLRKAIADACCSASVEPSRVQRTVIGAAGASVPGVRDSLHSMIGEVVGGDIEVVGDMIIAMEAAFCGGPGVIVVAGTGSIAYGRTARGDTARAGGWGYAISDEGSGHWIGRRIVSAALAAHDSGSDVLLQPILSAWKLSLFEELVKMANASPPPDFAELLPVALNVLQSTRSGSLWRIFEDAGHELGKLAATVLHRLWQQETKVTVAAAGGVFAHAPDIRKSFEASVLKAWPWSTFMHDLPEPVEGALWLARHPAAARK